MNEARLRILLIGSPRCPIAQPFAGGLESHVWHLARGLTQLGHEVTLFAGDGSDPTLGCARHDAETFRPGPSARNDASMPAENFLEDHHAYLKLMIDLTGSWSDTYDVVHNHSLHYLPVAMAPAMPIPMLCTLHTPPTPWLESALTVTRPRHPRFVAVSAHTAASWRHVVSDVTVVHNGVDLDRWAFGEGGDRAIWSGRITPEKAPHLAIDAARLAGYPIVVAGPISDPRYFADALVPRLGPDARYLGHLVESDLATEIGRSAVALVTPEWDEPYGLVVAEALACGTPVAAFARGGIPEVLTPDCGRLVHPGDVTALAAAIPEAAALSRGAARARAQRACSQKSMLTAYLGCYRDLLSHPAGETPRPRAVTADR
ncbi:glycosyltransferase [Rhodococcus triatomae]|nr:glycosyltransferase [Rhodococcus triatomae BKS 15-14]